ncbi:hypothetical protein BH20ACT3_BH20ACT3_09520 [soil metagenome]
MTHVWSWVATSGPATTMVDTSARLQFASASHAATRSTEEP